MIAAMYARVSTADKGQDPETQFLDMTIDARRRGWEVLRYVDAGISGTQARRPELDRLFADVRAGRIDVVMVQRFDRFARSMQQLVSALEEFRARNVQFISVKEGIDTTTPQGRLVFGIVAALAEFERELIRDRVRSGLANARAKGKTLGRPRAVVDLAKVTDARARLGSVRAVAREMSLSESTVRRALQKGYKRRAKNPMPGKFVTH